MDIAKYILIAVLFGSFALVGPAFVYIVALGSAFKPGTLKLPPLRRLILFAQSTLIFYAFVLIWVAIASSGVFGEFDVGERRITPLVLFSIVLVPIFSAVVGRIWVKMRSRLWSLQ